MNRPIKNEITIIFIAFFIKFVFVADPINENEVEQCRQILSIYSLQGDALTFFNIYLNLGQKPSGRNTNKYVIKYGNYAATKIIFESKSELVFADYVDIVTTDYILQPTVFCRNYIINTVLRAEINEDGQLLRRSYASGRPTSPININYENPENVLWNLNVDTQKLLMERRENCVRTLASYGFIYGMYAKEIFYLFFQRYWFAETGYTILDAYAKHVKGSSRKLARDAMNIEQYCRIQTETTRYAIRSIDVIQTQSRHHGGGIKIERYSFEQVVHDTFYVPTTHSDDTQLQNHDNFTTGGAGPSNQ